MVVHLQVYEFSTRFQYHNETRNTTMLSLVEYRFLWFMVFNTTFNNISVISWQSVLLVLKTRVPRENHKPATSH
jgi:hypothetical protein